MGGAGSRVRAVEALAAQDAQPGGVAGFGQQAAMARQLPAHERGGDPQPGRQFVVRPSSQIAKQARARHGPEI